MTTGADLIDFLRSDSGKEAISRAATAIAQLHISMLGETTPAARMICVAIAIESLARGRSDAKLQLKPGEMERIGPECHFLAVMLADIKQEMFSKNSQTSVKFWEGCLLGAAITWGWAGFELGFPQDELWGLKMPGCAPFLELS